jgi:hypothetical protein
MNKASKTPKKTARCAKRKRATNRPFLYEQVAKMWALKKTIPEIAKAIGRVGTGDDRFYPPRVALTKMHPCYKNRFGKIAKLPHRITRATLKAATRAGKRASA